MEFCFGTVLSTEVAYYTYIYTKVGKEHYQAVTSYMRTSSLLGRCIGCFLGQLLFTNKMVDKLCYIQLFGKSISFIYYCFHLIEKIVFSFLFKICNPLGLLQEIIGVNIKILKTLKLINLT